MKVAIIHDWLVTMGGAEKVLRELIALFPEADLYTTIDTLSEKELGKKAITSFLQKCPFSSKLHRFYFPLMPSAVEQFELSGYDLILSSSSSVAKGVISHPDQLHICYCHSPMRYAWDLQHVYLKEMGLDKGLRRLFMHQFLRKMRMWDLQTSFRVDHFIANSHFVRKRIETCYRREADVIYPPVDVKRFSLPRKEGGYYLTIARLVPYKRVDLIVDAFHAMPERKLVVIGKGPERRHLREAPNVLFLSEVTDGELAEYVAGAKGFVHAAVEDFGISLVEAQSAGVPVIAYGKGGALEAIQEGKTGLFFHEQSVPSLMEAIVEFEKREFSETALRSHAELFSQKRFRKEFSEVIGRVTK